jgi:hypothetical protein
MIQQRTGSPDLSSGIGPLAEWPSSTVPVGILLENEKNKHH